MHKLCLIALLGLAACNDTSLGLGIGLGSNGVSVRPTVTTNVGGVNVTVSN
jgi:hypothetical protein